MPYKSDKQRRFFHSPAGRAAGIKPETVQEFDQSSGAGPVEQAVPANESQRSAPHTRPAPAISSRRRKPKF